MLGLHGITRARLGRYRKGTAIKPLPGFVVPGTIAVVTAIIILAVARPIGG